MGELRLTYQAFDVRDAPGQQLIVYHAEPGGPSAEALILLGSVHATERRAAGRTDREESRSGRERFSRWS